MANPVLFLAQLNGSLAFQDRAGGGTLTGSGAVRYAPASGARTNLCSNPSFETNTTGWTASGATLNRVAGGVFGGYAAQLTGDTTVNNLFQGSGSSARMTVVPGQQYTLSCYVKSPNSNRIQPAIVWTNADGTGASVTTTSLQSVGTDYTQVSWTTTAPAGRTRASVRYYLENTANGDWTFDGIQFELGTSATDYFDGSTGGVWLDPITGILGTAHASPSVSQAVAWVEEGTTNLHPNPSFENATLNNAVVISGTTLTKDTAYAVLGSASCKCVTPNTVSGEGVNFTTASSLGYTGSARTFTGQLRIRGSGTVDVYVFVRYTDATFDNLAGTIKSSATLSDTWTTVTPGSVTVNASKTVDYVAVTVRTQTQQAATFYVDCVQIEEKSYATSYCDGSIGTGYAWSGTAHASSSTRTATTVTTDNANRINVTRGAYAIRALRQLDVVVDYRPLDIGSGGAGTDRIGAGISGGTDRFRIVTRSNSGSVLNTEAASPAIAVNTWYALFAEWSGTAVGAAVGTNVPTAGSRDAIQGTLNNGTTDFFIGSAISSAEQINGYIGPVLIADRPLTAKERATLSARTSWAWATLGGGGILRRGRVLATAGRR